MNEKETLSEVVDSLTDKPDSITVRIKPKNILHKWLISKGYLPKEKDYLLTRLVVGNAYRVAKAVLGIPEAAVIIGSEKTTGMLYSLLVNHLDKVIYVVAVAVTNTKEEPSQKLLDEIRWQFTDDELVGACVFILKRMNIQNFLNSIILIRGLDVISQTDEMSL